MRDGAALVFEAAVVMGSGLRFAAPE